MARLLFLPHRLPYPPDKGDKIRSYHLLRHLAARHEVTLATFVDDPDDEVHVDAVKALCREVFVARLHPRWSRFKSLAALATGGPMTLHYYAHAGLMRQVRAAAQARAFDASFVFSSSMVPYAAPLRDAGTPMLLDLVDVDSAKWAAYAPRHRWPMSWPLAREGRTLLAYERRSVALAGASFLCTEQECELFFCLAPESRGRVGVLRNGVDADHYRPDAAIPNPFEGTEAPIVFTGAMDYWPNVDAVCWFAGEVLPALRRAHPGARLHIVGRNPAPAVRELAGEGVHVTGTVPDVRPYLQHAAAVVAPLRVARGIQNKILEAMAMARPVVTTPPCAAALDATVGVHLMTATSADEYLDVLGTLLTDRSQAAAVGAAGRERVLATYSWPGSLRVLDERLGEVLGQRSRAAAAPAFVTAAAAERP